MSKPSKLLITGASGFIGSRLVIRAQQAGYTVIGASRHSTENLQKELGAEIISLDVLNPACEIPAVDTIVHCATANDILSRDFEAGVMLSVFGTRNLLEKAMASGVKRFVFFSTLQVYGTELNGDIDESTPVNCETPYALNHFFGEELCRMYAKRFGIDVIVLRPSNVYGVPDISTVNRTTLVPMCFVQEAVSQGAITLLSSGMQTRNFVSTDEVADVVLAALRDFSNGFTILNASSGWNSSILAIARMTAAAYHDVFNKNSKINIKSSSPESSNNFSVRSGLSYIRLSEYESAAKMQQTILSLLQIGK